VGRADLLLQSDLRLLSIAAAASIPAASSLLSWLQKTRESTLKKQPPPVFRSSSRLH
jgi:hypothetical protein